MRLQVQNYNLNSQYKNNNKSFRASTNPSFNGAYDRLTTFIEKDYYNRFYHSKFAKWIVDKTKNMDANKFTTHMAVLGSTLISGLYTVRTLQNDKLDSQKKKTLALNDVMTWGVATFLTYFADKKLAKFAENQTTRYAANYMKKHANSDAAKTLSLLGGTPETLKEVMATVGERLKKLPAEQVAEKFGAEFEKSYKSIEKFNLDILQDKVLDGRIKGMGVLKSLFIFGMIYRYIVPVLVMKPANKIGNYLHQKAEQKQAQETKKA